MSVKITPRARHDAVETPAGDVLRVRVTAPADDGKANAAVIALLARSWDVPKSTLSIVTGATSRHKRILVRGEPAALLRHLAARLAAA